MVELYNRVASSNRACKSEVVKVETLRTWRSRWNYSVDGIDQLAFILQLYFYSIYYGVFSICSGVLTAFCSDLNTKISLNSTTRLAKMSQEEESKFPCCWVCVPLRRVSRVALWVQSRDESGRWEKVGCAACGTVWRWF